VRFFQRTIIALLLLFVINGTANADRLDDYVITEMTKRGIPGLSIAVVQEGRVVRSAGYGVSNVENGSRTTDQTVFEIGSISKQFTAQAVILLVEDGKLFLDDPINKYLPPSAPDAWRPVTIRHLLNQTSGIKDWTEVAGFSYRRDYSPDEFIALIRDFPLTSQPGANWLYSNSNAPLAGMIVERASGKPYEEFVTERIFKPLGFPSLRFRHQNEVVPNRASGYVLREGRFENGEPFRPRIIAPSGGILATSIDLAKWFDALISQKIVKAGSVESILAPTRISDGRLVTHGLGIFKDSLGGHVGYFHHGSTVGGFGSLIKHFPKERITIAVLGNLEDGGFGPDVIMKRIADRFIPGAYVGGMKKSIDPDPELSRRLSGLLKDIAAGENSDLLHPGYASRISPAFRKEIGEAIANSASFQFLQSEEVGADHFMLDPTIRRFVHYRLSNGKRVVDLSFRFNQDNRIAAILIDR